MVRLIDLGSPCYEKGLVKLVDPEIPQRILYVLDGEYRGNENEQGRLSTVLRAFMMKTK